MIAMSKRPSISILDVIDAYLISDTKEAKTTLPKNIVRISSMGFAVDFSKLHTIYNFSKYSILTKEDVAYMCEKSIPQTVDNVNFNMHQCNCNMKICSMCDAQINLELIFEHLDLMRVCDVVNMFNDMVCLYGNSIRLKTFMKSKDSDIREWFEDKIVLTDHIHLLTHHCKQNFDISYLEMREITRLGLERKCGITELNKHKTVIFMKNVEKAKKIAELLNR